MIKTIPENKKSTLFILDESMKNTQKTLNKMNYKFDILVLGKLKQEITFYKKRYPLIKNF